MPRILYLPAIACAVFLGLLTPSAHAASAPKETTVAVMIQLTGSPTAADPNLKGRSPFTKWRYRFDPTLASAKRYRADIARYQSAELRYIQSKGIDISVDRQYDVLFNGFAASVPKSQLNALRKLKNVGLVTMQHHFHLLLDHSTSLVDAPAAWSQAGGAPNAGKGIMIAQVDTGIDIRHPCFSDKGMAPPPLGRHADSEPDLKLTNNKVIVARAFSGNSRVQSSAADAVGHGTFGAAIEACDYNTSTPLGTKMSGMAPGAYLMSYNVFPADAVDTPTEDPVYAGLQAALLDGADVVNMSLGYDLGTGDLSLDSFTQAVNVAAKAGVPIVVSAGNAGPTLQSVSAPAVASDAIAVGATTNSHVVVSSSVTIGGPTAAPSNLQSMRANQGTHQWTGPIGPAQMVYVGLGRKPNDDTTDMKADDFAGKDLRGKIALIQRGNILFESKIKNAAAAGAVGAIIFDNIDQVSLLSGDVKSATLPTAFIGKTDGQALLSWVEAHPDATATLKSDLNQYDETPNVISDFSSRGFGPDYSIKPDLVAPGQDIYSATESNIPNSEMYNASGFTSADGTSFSAPHVTGAAALLLQKHPKWTPAMVKAVLMQTANRLVVRNNGSTAIPPVTEQGSGLLDAGAAVAATAYLSPSSITFGQVNTALTTSVPGQKITLNDVGGGAGTWQIAQERIEGNNGVTLSVPQSVTLPAGGRVDIPVGISVSPSLPSGNYDGFLVLTHGTQTLHISFFVHAVTQSIAQGSVLLVDGTTSRYQSSVPSKPVVHKAVDKYFRDALAAIGKSYTYWDESKLGPPTLNDFKRASAVIVFTGANLNGFGPQNDNYEALLGPLGSLDVTAIRQYMDAGGRVFLTGLALGYSDPYWSALILGADLRQPSAYDNSSNDPKAAGGISPPQPSAMPDNRTAIVKNPYIFGGLKPIDFSTKGDGAGDNVASYSGAVDHSGYFDGGLVGVTGLAPINFRDNPRSAYGAAALRTKDVSLGGPDVGIVSSDEPSLTRKASYPGRSVFFSFDFAGINNNTGYATREQVLSRIFAWFADTPTARVTVSSPKARASTKLSASLAAGKGVHAVSYVWQIGTKTLKATSKPTTYTFPKAGQYNVRVLVTDSLGHKALSQMKRITVRG